MSRSRPLPDFGSVVRMTVQDVINWLSENKLNDTIKKFRQAGVDGNKLVHITATDLRNINVSKSDSKIILDLVSGVQKPNDRRGGGFNNFHNADQISDQESDDGGWDDDEFDDDDNFDDDSEEDYLTPKDSQSGCEEETYLDLSHPLEDDFQTPVAPPRPNRGRGGPLPPPPTAVNPSRPPKTGKARARTPPLQEEVYEDPDQDSHHSHRDPSPQETYEDPDNTTIPPRSRNGRPAPPTAQPTLPSRGRAPIPVPTTQYPDSQEVYEDVDQHDDPTPAPPPPRTRGRLPSPPSEEEPYEDISDIKTSSIDRDVVDLHVTPSQTKPEDYEEMTDEPPPPPRSKPKPPEPAIEPEDYEQVDEKVNPAPVRAPTLPTRVNLPSTPRIPIHNEETYEIPDIEPQEDDNYLDMEENNTTPTLPSRPPFRLPQVPVQQSELEEEDYVDVEDTLEEPQRPPAKKPVNNQDSDSADDYIEPDPKPKPPPPRQQASIQPQRRNTPPPIKRDKTPPKREENTSKRVLPPPPTGYNKIEVSSKGTPVLIPDNPTPPRKVSNENSEGYLEGQKFFHGDISRQDAEVKLRQYNVDGMYLIRRSLKNPNQPFTLQMYYQGYIYNLPVNKTSQGRYTISNERAKEFTTIREMVNHFKQHKLILKGGKETPLRESLPKS